MDIARTAIRILPFVVVGAASCAPLLGIEEATCDSSFDSNCITRVDPNQAGTGTGGSAIAGGQGVGGTAGIGGMAGIGGGAGMGGMGEESNASPECQEYCQNIAETCTEASGFLQYRTNTVCLTYCELFELGDPANPTGNNLACRRSELSDAVATGELAQHCPTAGPGGNGVCGDNCTGFCTAMVSKCGPLPDYRRYADESACLAECRGVPVLDSVYNTSVEDGDNFQCRLYHVTAATLRPGAHCPHASGEIFCLDEEADAGAPE